MQVKFEFQYENLEEDEFPSNYVIRELQCGVWRKKNRNLFLILVERPHESH